MHPRAHAPIQERDHVHGTPATQGADRTIGRTDTVVVTHPPSSQPPQSYGGAPEPRERDAVSPRSNASSVTVARPSVKGDAAHSDPSSRSHSRSPVPLPAHPQRNGSQVQPPPSKPPLPPSSGEGESDAEGDPEPEEVDDPDADLLAAVDAAEASSGKGVIAPWVKPVKREIEAT
jgi:hypothetical protein